MFSTGAVLNTHVQVRHCSSDELRPLSTLLTPEASTVVSVYGPRADE